LVVTLKLRAVYPGAVIGYTFQFLHNKSLEFILKREKIKRPQSLVVKAQTSCIKHVSI
jgi:hypothetical protein